MRLLVLGLVVCSLSQGAPHYSAECYTEGVRLFWKQEQRSPKAGTNPETLTDLISDARGRSKNPAGALHLQLKYFSG